MRKKVPSTPQSDMFTRLCLSELAVTCVKEYQFYDKRKWRFDYAIVREKIAIEVEGGVFTGGRHTRPLGFLKDMEKYNQATLMGWRVFRVTPDTLFSSETLEMLQQAIDYDFCREDI